MLHDLLVDIKLDKCKSYRLLETSAIESACAELEVAQLADILRKYTAADDMFTGTYLHGTNQNIKLMVDMGKAVDNANRHPLMRRKGKVRDTPLRLRAPKSVCGDLYRSKTVGFSAGFPRHFFRPKSTLTTLEPSSTTTVGPLPSGVRSRPSG
jgi:hypothetical protein